VGIEETDLSHYSMAKSLLYIQTHQPLIGPF